MATKKKEDVKKTTAAKAEIEDKVPVEQTPKQDKAKKIKLKYDAKRYLWHIKSGELSSVGDMREEKVAFHNSTAESLATSQNNLYKILTKAQVLKKIEKGEIEYPDA